ncbi:helix-turn-helix transcriptional regulator [Paenirhodobacter populi]|uniref:helix-turn-helix transcriptional regulator n=1 Tax=Paenirhodobacter populi TaxID=2306993 RepID=UPI000FE3407F|nr:hypothetical protein [Sinirhodobacter populi]
MFFDTVNPDVQDCFQTGYSPDKMASFMDYYGAINPYRAQFAHMTPLVARTPAQLLSHRDLVKTEFHADWLRPQGDISAGAGMILQRDARRLLLMGGHIRMKDQDRLEAPWMMLANMLGPALRHAVELNHILSGLRLENALLAQGLTPTGAAILVLSDDRRILFANAMGERDLARGEALGGDLWRRLHLRDALSDRAFEAGLRRCRPNAPPIALRVAEPGTGARRIAHLLRVGPEVLPFAGIDTLRRTAPDSVVVLVIPAASAAETLMRYLGLTLAESEVALALHSGQTPAEIAAARGVSVHTVRSQTKAVLGKCAVRRQSELVALIGRLVR